MDAVKGALASGDSAAGIIKTLQQTGVGVASQSMTTLSLGLEAQMSATGSDGWGAIAAKAGGAALLLDALFTSGYAPALQVNEGQPFYADAGLADRVRALLNSNAADFTAAAEYLPDAQALAWLVSSIDSSFSTDDLNALIDAASASGDQAGAQHLVEALSRIVSGGAGSADSTPAGFYRSVFATIDAVQAAYPAGLELQSLVSTSATLISDSAGQTGETGVAYRYALNQLNVFVLVGADYSDFNANGELDLYDEATGHGTFTADYLADRPELLAAMVRTNIDDLVPNSAGTTVVPGLGSTYADSDAGIRLTGTTPAAGLVLFNGDTGGTITGTDGNDHLYGEGGDDVIIAGAGNDMLDGGVGNDDLSGGAGDDIVMGGAGADTLRGGAGKDLLQGGAGDDLMIGDGDGDILEGGTGMDTYRVRRGDVIRDADGQGTIQFGDAATPTSTTTVITGGTAVGEGPLYVELRRWGGLPAERRRLDRLLGRWPARDGAAGCRRRRPAEPPRRRRTRGRPGAAMAWSAASRCWACCCARAARRSTLRTRPPSCWRRRCPRRVATRSCSTWTATASRRSASRQSPTSTTTPTGSPS